MGAKSMIFDITTIIPILFNFSMWIKLFSLVLIFFYFILSLVIVRQVKLVGQLVQTEFSPVLQILTVLHSFAVFGLFILTWMLI